MGGVGSGLRRSSHPLDRWARLGRYPENKKLGVARTDSDSQILAEILAGGKKEGNVGVTTNGTDF